MLLSNISSDSLNPNGESTHLAYYRYILAASEIHFAWLTNRLCRSKIVITSRRPTQIFWQDPRVVFVALDFLKPSEELAKAMAPLCHDVTHAFFASYVHTADFKTLKDSNVPLFKNFLVAVDTVAASSLERIIVHTGGKVSISFSARGKLIKLSR